MKVVLPLETNLETNKATSATLLLSRLVIVLGMTLLTSACASEPANQQAAVSVVAAVEEECRSELVAGSNFPRRTCRTAEEWASIDGEQGGGAD